MAYWIKGWEIHISARSCDLRRSEPVAGCNQEVVAVKPGIISHWVISRHLPTQDHYRTCLINKIFEHATDCPLDHPDNSFATDWHRLMHHRHDKGLAMTIQRFVTICTVSTLVFVCAGCTAISRDGRAIGVGDAHQPQQYQKYQAMQFDEISAPSPVLVVQRSKHFRSGLEAANLNSMNNTSPPEAAIGSLNLYGQVERPREGLASAMDGLDNLWRVTVTSEGADFDPTVDPTGQRVVYASTRHRETADIYLKQVEGSAITQLTDDPANDVMPSISPDGKRVAFASDRAGNWDIYLMDIDGGRAIKLTQDPTHDIHPTFSPDGKKLAYCSYGTPSGQWEMIIIDIEKSATKKYIGHGLFPTWSPIGNRILYQRARERGTRWFGVWTIQLKEDGDAGQPTELAASANAAVITPDWSPDGKHIVFCTVIDPDADDASGPGQADIWIMNADGSGRTRLTEGRFANLQPAWSQTGSIFFVSDRGVDSVENVWALRPDRALQLAARKEDQDELASVMAPAAE